VTGLYSGASQPFVMLAGAGHVPSSASPLASDSKKTCGGRIIDSFVRNDEELDVVCQADLAPILYAAPTAEFAQKWWGTTDDWGDGVPAPMMGAAPQRPVAHGIPASAWQLPSPAIALHLSRMLRARRP
jgi:hypothetical protein